MLSFKTINYSSGISRLFPKTLGIFFFFLKSSNSRRCCSPPSVAATSAAVQWDILSAFSFFLFAQYRQTVVLEGYSTSPVSLQFKIYLLVTIAKGSPTAQSFKFDSLASRPCRRGQSKRSQFQRVCFCFYQNANSSFSFNSQTSFSKSIA